MRWKKITVAYIVFCVSKCLAVSRNELEDFVEFIQKTSHLDEPLILKKGTRPGDEFDEDDPVSDHAWEESGKFEGDLILNERQRRIIIQDVAEGLARNGLTDTTKRWPGNEVIYYIQKEHFSNDQVQAIQDGIDDLAQASCVKFRPYRRGDKDAVVVQGSRRGCFSQVGYQGGYQVLNLSGRHPVGRGCFRHGTVVHEFLHTLGFFHMQSSPDRDDYIDVLWQNIIQPAKHNFRKYNTFSVSDFGVGYDYDSVLHYSRKAFSSNGGDTLVPKQGGASIGQRVGLSDKDVKKLNKMYCDADSDSQDETSVDPHLKVPKTTSTKKSKNKPFTGHGIGYHKGKTVVIKLPAAETYKLSDLPTFHMFDYFSKTPQTMSPATFIEGLGVGKEISYNHMPPAMEQYKPPYESEGYKSIAQSNEAGNHKELINTNNHSKHNKESHKKSAPKIEESSNEDYDIDEAFERLGKIIKSQVYPSQERHYSHRESDYSKFFRPIKEKTPYSLINKGDNAIHASPLNNMSEEKTNEHLSQQFIKGLSDGRKQEETLDENKKNIPAPFSINKMYLSKDPYYGTAFPYKGMKVTHNEKLVTPDYAKFENLRHKHNFSSLYKPVVEDASDSSFIGADVPSSYTMSIEAESQEKEENIKNDNDKYNVYEYTYHPSQLQDKAFALRAEPQGFKLQLKSDLRNVHFPSEGHPAYKLFGVLVPITQNWFKTDYDTHLGDYSRDTSRSSKDHG